MPEKDVYSMTRRWILTGAICGLLTSLIYTAVQILHFPLMITVILAGSIGILLSIAAIGLYQLLRLHRKTVSLQLAALFTVIAGVTVNLMLIVQLTVRQYMSLYMEEATNEYARDTLTQIWKAVDKVQLGLDISWDFYITVGTFLFGVNMLRHPLFGKIFGTTGMLIAVLLLGFNLYTFPVPPAAAGLIDFGPLLGLWYAIVAIQVFRSLKWVEITSTDDTD